MKLYTVRNNPTGRKILAVMNHMGLSCEVENISIADGDTRKAGYLEINPNGLVPALVDGTRSVWESNAINIYLCTEKLPGHALFAPGIRTDIEQWLFWEAGHYNAAMRILLRELIIKQRFGLGDPVPEIVEFGKWEFYRWAQVLEQHLEGRDFMVGETWTLADYAIGFLEGTVKRLPIEIASYPNIAAFYERFRMNPHWLASGQTEG